MSEQINSDVAYQSSFPAPGILQNPAASWDSPWNRWAVMENLLSMKAHLSTENLIKEAEKIINFVAQKV